MSFDAIATHYRWMERVTAGPLLQRCRTEFIHQIKDARNILLLGEGRGRFLMDLLRQNPEAHITCVDASARMLELTRADLEKRGLLNRSRPSPSSSGVLFEDEGREPESTSPSRTRVRFIHADTLTGTWSHGGTRHDAVASHFFLDCFRQDQLGALCSRVALWTAPGAPWLISDFCVPERGWRRLRARGILWGMYRFFGRTTRLPANRLTPPDEHMEAAGFQLRSRKHFNHGLLHSDVWGRT